MDSLVKNQKGPVEVITIRGRILQDDSQDVENALQEALDEKKRFIIVDLSGVNHICSSALGILISMKRRMKKRDGDIKLVIVDGDVRSLIEITMLDRVFQIYETVDAAQKTFDDLVDDE